MEMKPLPVVAAYGRRYGTSYSAIKDWYCGRDFKIVGGPYVSERDTMGLLADGWTHVQIVDVQSGEILALLYLGMIGLQAMSI